MTLKLADPKDEYNKDPKLKPEDVKKLQEWITHQAHLPKITELQIILFLQSCYYSNEAAKTAIDNYFTVKTLCPDLFGNRSTNESAIYDTMNTAMSAVLPKMTPEGYRIIFYKVLDSDVDKFNFPNQLRAFDMMAMYNLHTQGPCKGIIIVFDTSGVVFGHMTKLNLLFLKKFFYYLQEAMPLRLKGMHYFNLVSFMDKLLGMMRPFMKKELQEMLYLHGNMESLYKSCPQECLPNEYGGSAGSLKEISENNKKIVRENKEFFRFEDSQLVDEKKRTGKPKNSTDFFGVEGTFKKLELD